ncbi:Crooked neck-like protein 1 [Rhizopus azygosporus]|uniref:Crooked neck-like protein 1 n=1 Tax=Rhizopus azygosporus TaxID=86630 RepID=A0A367JVL9_RHIAZ|nr:Crooked neck-like protein 1 [Rhizopus azygosporus]
MDSKETTSGFGKNPRPPKVKNKAPAPIQITAEQILREAHDRRLEPTHSIPQQKIADLEELSEFRQRKRKEFEDNIRKNRLNISNWIKYANWEESQMELQRARSVFERALDVEWRNVAIWLRYIDMELKNKCVNHARNLLDRATTLMPRMDQFWYKYTYMEETLGEVPKARNVFERWMKWEPPENAWMSYIKMELRYDEKERARAIYERFVSIHPEPANWIKWAKFEEEQNNLAKCREIYTAALEYLGDEKLDQKVLVAFAKFEIKTKEFERARVIFKYGLERLPKAKSQSLYNQYTNFEKQYGDKAGIEDVVIGKRRVQYEREIDDNPKNYDVWFDYAKLEESAGDPTRVREVYERAIAQVPPAEEKRYWRRYIYLWIYYALYEELETQDMERTREIYEQCIKLIPHKKFTFAKIWLLYAQFEIRQLDVQKARKLLGRAIGMCPKSKLFKGYIDLEFQMREFDRCRTLYTKYLEYNPANCSAWIKFAELERDVLGETERCRAIFDLGIAQPALDMPELLWKAYIDFEIAEEEYDNARDLYHRLLERTEHVKVYISFAQFELSIPYEEGSDENVKNSRNIFAKAYDKMKEKELKEERVILLEAWKDFEENYGTDETKQAVQQKMPKVVKKRRQAKDSTEDNIIWEEYFDYIFPDDKVQSGPLKLLQMAQAWKKSGNNSSNDS